MQALDLQSKFQSMIADPSLQIHLNKDWCSRYENYRHNIRAQLLLQLSELNDTTPKNVVFDLTKPPRLNSYYVSISHSQTIGGFALSKKIIGFDIEDLSRVNETLIQRVAKKSPEPPPFPAALWCALEASFKAFSIVADPVHFTEITVSDWELHNQHHVYSFKSKFTKTSQLYTGAGVVTSTSNHAYALIALNS